MTAIYRSNANYWKEQHTIANATVQTAIDAIAENNARTARITIAMDKISESSALSREALNTLEKKLNELPVSTVCIGSPPLDATREWLREQTNPKP